MQQFYTFHSNNFMKFGSFSMLCAPKLWKIKLYFNTIRFLSLPLTRILLFFEYLAWTCKGIYPVGENNSFCNAVLCKVWILIFFLLHFSSLCVWLFARILILKVMFFGFWFFFLHVKMCNNGSVFTLTVFKLSNSVFKE